MFEKAVDDFKPFLKVFLQDFLKKIPNDSGKGWLILATINFQNELNVWGFPEIGKK